MPRFVVMDAPWWHSTTVYQVYPRSFRDSNGDGIGDLPGIVERLDHLVDLGVDTLWVSPFFSSPQEDFGYDVTDYCDVAAEYGTLEDAERLIDEAHRRGLRVLFDLVLNHTSHLHPWFLESRSSRDNPKADWYLWRDGRGADARKPPNNWRSVAEITSGWQWDGVREQWYLASFLPCQPDLNWRNPEVRESMFAAVRFWLERGVDGFRLDMFGDIMKDEVFADLRIRPRIVGGFPRLWDRTPIQNTPDNVELARELRQVCREFDDVGGPVGAGATAGDRERILIGEVFGNAEELRRFLVGEDGLQLVFLFDFLTFRYDEEWLTERIVEFETAFPHPAQPTYVLENHDRTRLLDRVGGDPGKARVMATLLCMLRGVPTIYQGQEIGQGNTHIPLAQAQDPIVRTYFPWLPEAVNKRLRERPNRDEVRTPMQWDSSSTAGFCAAGVTPWLPVNRDRATANVASQRDDADSMLALYRDLLRVRRDRSALHAGRLDLVPGAPAGTVAWMRSDGRERILVAANLSEAPSEVPLGGVDGELLVSSDHAVRVESPGTGPTPGGVVWLPAHSAAVVALSPVPG
jgi:alpha-glucosidase